MDKTILKRLGRSEQRIVDLYNRLRKLPTSSGSNINASFTESEAETGGTWIDGKPIYRVVVAFNIPALTDPESSVLIDHQLGIDKYLRADVVVDLPVTVTTEDAAWFFPIIASHSVANCAIASSGVVMLNRMNVTFESCNSAIAATNNFLLVLEYTKA